MADGAPLNERNTFTQSEMDDFERDGFVICRGLFSREEIQTMASWVDEIVAAPTVPGGMMPYYETSKLDPTQKVLSRIEKFADHHEKLREFCYDQRVVERSKQLLKGEVVMFKEKINFKMPGGDGFAPHQDIQPGWSTYAQYFISVLITIDDSTVENGCLELSPGHHKNGMIGEMWKPLTPEQLKGVEFTKHPSSPGDVFFFDCFVPHQSLPNLTSNQRRNMYLTFNSTTEGDHRQDYYSDKRKNFPPDHEREAGTEYSYKV